MSSDGRSGVRRASCSPTPAGHTDAPSAITRSRLGSVTRVSIDRGFFAETWTTGQLAAGPETRASQEALAALRSLSTPGSATRLRLLGAPPEDTASIAAELCPHFEAAGAVLEIDAFTFPGEHARSWIGVQALTLEPRPGGRLERIALGLGGEAWVLTAGDRAPTAADAPRLAYLFGIASADPARLPAYAATFDQLFAELPALGFAPPDLARTWCFFREVLADYPGFNEMRRACYEGRGLLGRAQIPASTGIQCIPSSGAHLQVDALLARGEGVRLSQLQNPAQCEATAYGSLFSRAIQIEGLGPALIVVSGMASIDDAEGETLHKGDARAQTDTTLEKAAALLEDAGSSLDAVVSGIVYLKPGHEALLAHPPLAELVARLPLAPSIGDVCRDDLLFEIELMATVSPKP